MGSRRGYCRRRLLRAQDGPDLVAAGSQPLAFAELAFGGLLITSAITGESVGELLTNGLTKAGKERLHSKGQSELGLGSEFGGPQAGAASGGSPGSVAVNPNQIKLQKFTGRGGGTHQPETNQIKNIENELEGYLHRHLSKNEIVEVEQLVAQERGRYTVRITPSGQLH